MVTQLKDVFFYYSTVDSVQKQHTKYRVKKTNNMQKQRSDWGWG